MSPDFQVSATRVPARISATILSRSAWPWNSSSPTSWPPIRSMDTSVGAAKPSNAAPHAAQGSSAQPAAVGAKVGGRLRMAAPSRCARAAACAGSDVSRGSTPQPSQGPVAAASITSRG